MSEIDLTIQEVAWAALQDPVIRGQIGDKLDLSEVWLKQVYGVLEETLNGKKPDPARELANQIFGFKGAQA